MSGTKKEHVKIILQTIENGTLSEAETEQRLLGLVRQEAERKDRPADLGLIRACVELGSEPVVFGMEATGHYWLTLYTHLRNDGFTVHVINPTQSDALRGMYIRKTKTDSVDSVIIADVIRFGRYCETSVDPGDLQAMRELCRQRFYIIDMASDLKRKVIALLDQVFPEYEKLFSDSFGLSSMELLSQYTTPEEMLSVSSQQLAEVLKKPVAAGWARKKPSKFRTQPKFFRHRDGFQQFFLIIRQYIEQIRSLESSVDIFDTEIARLLSGFDTQLTTITGIGSTLAAVILSEIGGDIRRFSSPAKLAAYAGVDPTVKQSGDFSGTRIKMSKRGSPYLRRAIWLASTVAAFKDPVIHALYERKRAEGKDHMTVIGHVCRKMISIIFAVLRDNTPYVPAGISD